MPKAFEGSMAVSRGSHQAPWRWEAYEAIGQDRTRSGLSKEALFEVIRQHGKGDKPKFATCEGIKANRSDLREKLEETSEIFDLQTGDVIFATRLLFHRTLAVTPEGQEFYGKKGKEVLMRHSIRYVPGTARLLEGFSAEWSILDNPANRGRTLDEVVDDKENECWYPKVWPTVDETIGVQMDKIDESKLAQVKEKEKEVYTELRQVMQS
jgi:hypothetical protein